MNILQFLNSLRPAIPMSQENPCKIPSNGELKRWINNGSVLINGKKFKHNDSIPLNNEEIESIVFFPKSKKMKTTIW